MRQLLVTFSRHGGPTEGLLIRSALVECSALPAEPRDFCVILGMLTEPGWYLVGCQPLVQHGEDQRPFVVLGFSPLPMSGGQVPSPRPAWWRRWLRRAA